MAKKLMETDGAIAPAPGQLPEARMVLSYSGKPPHMVTPKRNGDFSCDSSCPNWKSLGICSHSVAVAETNGRLQEFLSAKKKKTPSVTGLLTTNMPKGRGRKGGVPPRVRKPKQPVTTRIEMNDATSTTSTPVAFQQSTIMTPNFHLSPTAMTSQYNIMQSPFYGTNHQMYQPGYSGHQDWRMGYSTFSPSLYQCPSPAPPPPPPASLPPASPPQYQPPSPFVLCFISGKHLLWL